MYKVLLCWRYLRTRFLALACVVSVMLGVATLIVVNSVMGGFSSKLRDRLHGLLSDVVVEVSSLEGFPDPDGKMAKILADPYLRERIEVMAPTLEVFAMLQYRWPNGEIQTRPVRLVGIDLKSRLALGGFREHLAKQKETAVPSFQPSADARMRYEWRNQFAQHLQPPLPPATSVDPSEPPPPVPPPSRKKEPHGIFVGHLIATVRTTDKDEDGKYVERYLVNPGDEVILTTVTGNKLQPVQDCFLVVDYFQSGMSEYDNNYVFVPLDYLQHLRSMPNRITSIEIKLKDYDRDAKGVVERLRTLFPNELGYFVNTWEDKQGPLLAAISIERGILNVLLFLIIGVAGFGILAIFSMIVTEKTRDIGVLKALGASHRGVMGIFLGYGLLLGVVGAVLGTILGVALTNNINAVEQALSSLTGVEVFNRKVYYFDQIPTEIQPWGIVWLNLGAIAIAVFFSVLPALRAAFLHPVKALRYE